MVSFECVSLKPDACPPGSTITTDDISGVVAAVLHHGLLIMRSSSVASLAVLADLIGDSEDVLPVEYRYPGSTTMRLQSNVEGLGANGGGMYWHADGSWLDRSHDLTLLACVEAPGEGGTTRFVDAAEAYGAFPAAVRELLDRLEGHFPNEAVLAADLEATGILSPEMQAGVSDRVHPIVRTHPLTGRRALIINEMWMRSIVGLPGEVSEMVLGWLSAQVERSPFTYEHQWQVGDLLIWDNHRMLHKATVVTDASAKITVRVRVPHIAEALLK